MRNPITLTHPACPDRAMHVCIAPHPHGGGDWAVITDQLTLGAVWASVVSRDADNLPDISDEFDALVDDARAGGWADAD